MSEPKFCDCHWLTMEDEAHIYLCALEKEFNRREMVECTICHFRTSLWGHETPGSVLEKHREICPLRVKAGTVSSTSESTDNQQD